MSIVTTWTTLLLTGLRGNGKTLKAVQMMDEFIKAGHPVYACNFDGLALPGVQFIEDPHGWRDLPPGSILFVDEAQRFWRSRRSGDPPESIIAMETQRHDGVRMVVLTQQPTYLDKHLRGLVDAHVHLIRRAGMQASQVYQWERCHEEPLNPSSVDLAEKSMFIFPKEYFGQYTSAEVHTVKAKVPTRLKLIVAGVLFVVCAFAYAVSSLKKDDAPVAPTTADASPVASAAGDAPGARARGRRTEPMTREQYLAQMVPRIDGAPWSAPVYDEFNDVSEPAQVACMIGSTCRCITTQGTRYAMDQGLCRRIVENGGMFNPYKANARRDQWGRDDGEGREPGGGTAPTPNALSGIVLDSAAVTGQGAMTRADRFDPAADHGYSGGG